MLIVLFKHSKPCCNFNSPSVVVLYTQFVVPTCRTDRQTAENLGKTPGGLWLAGGAVPEPHSSSGGDWHFILPFCLKQLPHLYMAGSVNLHGGGASSIPKHWLVVVGEHGRHALPLSAWSISFPTASVVPHACDSSPKQTFSMWRLCLVPLELEA